MKTFTQWLISLPSEITTSLVENVRDFWNYRLFELEECKAESSGVYGLIYLVLGIVAFLGCPVLIAEAPPYVWVFALIASVCLISLGLIFFYSRYRALERAKLSHNR